MYNEPLCVKCLHPINYHTEIVADLQDTTEIRRCTIDICFCIIHVKVPQEEEAVDKK
jgi:hypothetical protein